MSQHVVNLLNLLPLIKSERTNKETWHQRDGNLQTMHSAEAAGLHDSFL